MAFYYLKPNVAYLKFVQLNDFAGICVVIATTQDISYIIKSEVARPLVNDDVDLYRYIYI